MPAFGIVIIVVCLIALAFAVKYFGGFSDIGHRGHGWVEHDQDIPISERPSEDEPDQPLPRRPVRRRPE